MKPVWVLTHNAALLQLNINMNKQKTNNLIYIEVQAITLESISLNIKFISRHNNTKYCLGEGFYLLFLAILWLSAACWMDHR